MSARPNPSQRELAAAVAAYHAHQVQQAERKAGNALVGVVFATLLACLATWLLLSWGECLASGAAMCSAVITPTRRAPWHRLRDAARRLYLQMLLRAAENDVRWLEADKANAEAWLETAPGVIANYRAYAAALRVELISGMPPKGPRP